MKLKGDILDVGCGEGHIWKYLKYKNVYGIEIDRDSAKIARKYMKEVYALDIEKNDIHIPMNRKFDTIICADVLEHVRHPEIVLSRLRKHLKKDGAIVISMPNFINWSIRLRTLFGLIKYTETGIMDETHLRFYSKKSFAKILKKNGFHIIKHDYTPNFARAFFMSMKNLGFFKKSENPFDSKMYGIYRKTALPVENLITRIWPNLFAYQTIFVVKL